MPFQFHLTSIYILKISNEIQNPSNISAMHFFFFLEVHCIPKKNVHCLIFRASKSEGD